MLFTPVRPHDTYLVSFPRSGSTWLRCMLTSLVHGTSVTPELVAATVPDVHRSSRTRPHRRRPLVAKSHTPFVDMPARVVYLVRDGRDALLSYHQYLVRRGRIAPYAEPRETFFRADLWPCPWHVHVTGWLDGIERRATADSGHELVVRYEDLVADPARHLADVAALAGLPTDAARVARAVELNQRERLTAVERDRGAGSLNHLGAVRGEWHDALDHDDRTRYEALAGPALTRLGYPVTAR
jgi:hypothetical protein